MFDKFGEMDYEELIRTARAEKEEGDEGALIALAQENGLDKEDAEDYMDGLSKELATPLQAAEAKVSMEAKELELDGIVDDWKSQIIAECMEDTKMCLAVRKKEKSLAACMAALIRFAFENKVQISDKIVKITKVTHNGKESPMRSPLYLGVPNRSDARRLIRDYYLSGQEE